jgi:phenylacetate-CoA ligase
MKRHDLYTELVSHILFPLHERLKGHNTTRIRRDLEVTQYYSREQLKGLQSERLQRLVRRAVTKVPYYRKIFTERGLVPSSIRVANDLTLLPFLTKQIIRNTGDKLKAEDARKLVTTSTSGSTGDPLTFRLGLERISHDVAAKWRATRWWGVDIGDPEIVFWASSTELSAQSRVKRWRDRLLRSTLLNAMDLSNDQLAEFAKVIHNTKPKMIFGYTAAISRLARYLLHKDIRINTDNLCVVFVTTEKLLEEQRKNIKQVFGCPVADGYGGRDAGFIAHECPSGNLHITAEDIIVEIVGEDGRSLPSNQPGEVVVTHLASGDFPLIRYKTGDIGILSDDVCSCGRNLPLLKDVQGRTNDFLITSDHRTMHYTTVSHLLKEIPDLYTFKVIQENLRTVRFLLVAERTLSQSSLKDIRERLERRLGERMIIIVEQVPEIPLETSGKHRHIVNHVVLTEKDLP